VVGGQPELPQRPGRRGQRDERLVDELGERDRQAPVTGDRPAGDRATGDHPAAVRVTGGEPVAGGQGDPALFPGDDLPAELRTGRERQPRDRHVDLALASPAVGSAQDTWRNSSFHSGCSRSSRPVTIGIRPRPIRVWNPTVSVLVRAAPASSRSVPLHWSSSALALGSSAAPAGVSATVRRSRSNSVTRRVSSSWRICLLSVGWAMNSRLLAALVKLSSSATATK